jgi:DNA-binding LytR/AlgR family response regulator
MARAVDFDVAFLDINLGRGETSFEAADIILDRGLPFAFLTGSDMKAVRPDLRGRTVIQKPINVEQLRRFLVSL